MNTKNKGDIVNTNNLYNIVNKKEHMTEIESMQQFNSFASCSMSVCCGCNANES